MDDGTHKRLRVMVDTTVLVAGSRWPRWPREVLLAGLDGAYELVLCPYVLDEARRVIANRFPQEHLARFEEFLRDPRLMLAQDASADEIVAHQGLVRDCTDLPIVVAALNAGVDYLVSEDKDLTAQDATTAHLHERLSILLSGTFLRLVLGWSSQELERLRGRTWADVPDESDR